MEWEISTDLLVQECRELLCSMENSLLDIERQGPDDNNINAVFRAAHTIKGSAGMFGLDTMVSFTHIIENVLDEVRNQLQPLTPDLIACLFECGDYLTRLVDVVAEQGDLEQVSPKVRSNLTQRLQAFLHTDDTVTLPLAPEKSWKINARFAADCLSLGVEPVNILRHLQTLGKVENVCLDLTQLPPLSSLGTRTCYLAYSLNLRAHVDEAIVRGVFEHFADDSDIDIATSAPPATVPAREGRTNSRAQSMLKVEARKLDDLINAVGELAIRCANCDNHVVRRENPVLAELLAEVNLLVEDVRDRALDLRMVPIGEVFQRFPRLVRDIARELGKDVELVIQGADTELDKAMVECLTDPLLHIVRNAMDHGIEPVDERRALGKPEKGQVLLEARHQSGNVIIEIRDDGRGLDREKIRRKAIERQLIGPDTELAEKDILNLLFAPGFSTAERVTDLSGRGVGMDVVRQNLARLNGSIDIQSSPGAGTCFTIQLPLTLAIIDGFQVAVGDSQFVLPLDLVEECIDFTPSAEQQRIFNLRGQALPYVQLAEEFVLSTTPGHTRHCMVVVGCGRTRAGLVVERFVGEVQAVVKPLGHLLARIPGLSGSTILGDGRVALLIDVAALLTRAMSSEIQSISSNRTM